jgi:hypothetical protein
VKRKTFYHIALSLPYIALIFSGAFAFSLYAAGFNPSFFGETQSGWLGVLIGTVLFFLTGGIVWGPLYTWLVVALLFWGRGKNADEVRSMYLLSPILLGCAMGIPILFIDIRHSMMLLLWGFLHMANMDFSAPAFLKNESLEASLAVGVIWGMLAAICVVVGYVFVGIAVLIEKVLKRRGLFTVEEAPAEMPPLL